MKSRMLPSSDAGLLRLACLGDEAAFGEIYNRYFPRVYDFLLRTTRNGEEAADLAQETFLRAMQNLTAVRQPDRLKSWLFAIAHNLALTRLERQQRIAPRPQSDGEQPGGFTDPLLRQVDTDRLANPEQAAEALALVDLVWEAAQALDRRQYALLDLHVRQGLDSAEIAEVLGVSKGNAYTMVNRMKKAVEEAIGAFLLARRGSKDCEELQAILAPYAIPPVTPELRKAIDRHVSRCAVCDATRKRLVSPIELFGAIAPAPVPLGLQESIWSALADAWPEQGPAASADDGILRPPPETGLLDGFQMPGWRRWQLWAILGMFAVAVLVPALILALLLGGGSDDGSSGVAASGDQPRSEVAGEEVTPTNTHTPTETEEPTATEAPTSTPQPTRTPTPTPRPGAEPPAQQPPPRNRPPEERPTRRPTATPTPRPAPDTTGPIIASIFVDPGEIWESGPTCPQPNTAHITARVADFSGVASVQLAWSAGLNVGYTDMTRAGTLVSADVGPFPMGTVGNSDTAVVSLLIRAVDNRGNASTARSALTLHACQGPQ